MNPQAASREASGESRDQLDHSAKCLLTDCEGRDFLDSRRLSVAGHHEFRESLAGPARAFDEIDELVEEIRRDEFEGKGARP